MTDRGQDALILCAALAVVSLVGMVVAGAHGDPRSRLYRPARLLFATLDIVGRQGPLWIALGGVLVLSQCQQDAYRAGYEAHVMECVQSIAQCRGGKVP